jgi:hypothetical protein
VGGGKGREETVRFLRFLRLLKRPNKMSSGLLELIKQRTPSPLLVLPCRADPSSASPPPPTGYLDTLRSVPSRWKILIVDQFTQQMLQSVLSTYDVLEEGIQRAFASLPLRSLSSSPCEAVGHLKLTRCSHRGRRDHRSSNSSTSPRRRLPPHANNSECRPRPP